MKRVLILVEGQTEEAFVRDVLTSHLASAGVHPTPVLLKTKRVKAGGTFKGGVTSTAQVLGDLRLLLGDTGATAVTSIIDYYGLPEDFPGMDSRPAGDAYARVAHVEAALATLLDAASFIPHLVLHEYEAWVFSAPDACSWVFDDDALPATLAGIRTTAGGAERINEHRETAPSKRLAQAFPAYQKTLHGPMAVGAIGLSRLRATCPHADAWLRELEAL